MLDDNIIEEIGKIVVEPIQTLSCHKIWRRISICPLNQAVELLETTLRIKHGHETSKVRAMREILGHIKSYEQRL